jgi:LysR family transcriptional regulator, low CO2-responsive transcriptional regulator
LSQLTIPQIRAVEAVARLQSFTRAGEALSLSQPTVSTQVRAVEELCSQRIFVRTGGAVTLSPGAHAILARIRVALKSIDDLESHLAGTASLDTGALALGFSAHRIIMPLMRQFVELYPQVALRARSASSTELIAGIESGTLDVAAVTWREVDKRFASHQIARRGFVVYGKKGHPLCRGPKLDIRKLAGVPMVLWNHGSHTRQVLEAEANRLGVAITCALEVGSWDAAFASTAAGIGLGVALEGEVEADEQVDVRPLIGGNFEVGQYLICLPEFRDFAAVSKLFVIAERLGGEPERP